MKYFVITEPQAKAIAEYLIQKPYREVKPLVDILELLKPIEPKGPVADKIPDTETETKLKEEK
jgi:hypothetical protein